MRSIEFKYAYIASKYSNDPIDEHDFYVKLGLIKNFQILHSCEKLHAFNK